MQLWKFLTRWLKSKLTLHLPSVHSGNMVKEDYEGQHLNLIT